MKTQMAGNPAQVHPVHIHLDRLLPNFFWIFSGFGFRGVLDLAELSAIPLAAAVCFSSSVLSFGSMAVWTFSHTPILANLLATPHRVTETHRRVKKEYMSPRGRRFAKDNRIPRFMIVSFIGESSGWRSRPPDDHGSPPPSMNEAE
jgi:hypothetical protein